MNNFRSIWEKTLALLRIKPRIGGLEISDSFLRYVYVESGVWQTASVKLAPNVVKNGKVVNPDELAAALGALHDEILPGKKRDKINAVISLSSVNVYSQVFSLPVIEGENLEKAIQLNIQMVSPAESSQTYSGWQMVGEDQKSVRLEILSSFINREVVDQVSKALVETNFVIHSIESRALSLVRLLRRLGIGFDQEKSYIMVSIDSTGLEFLIVRRAQLYFQYFNSWQDLYGGEKKITKEAFEAAIIRNLHQVLNFYNSHWSEPLAGVFLSTLSLKDQVTKIVTENFSLNILEMQLNLPQAVNPDWFVSLGASLRSLVSQKEDREISLLGISAQDEFREVQAIMFVRFWRLVVPLALLMLVLVFGGADYFLARTSKNLESKAIYQNGGELAKIQELQAKMNAFNRSVVLLQAAVSQSRPKGEILKKLMTVAGENGVKVNRIAIPGGGGAISFSGQTESEDRLKSFAELLKKEATVTLPLSDVRTTQEGVTFSMTIAFTSANTP